MKNLQRGGYDRSKSVSVLKRLFSSLRAQGLKATAFKLRTVAADRLFDLKYGIETCSWTPLDSLTVIDGNKEAGYPYQPTHATLLRNVFQGIQPLLPERGVVVDFGSGKGRTLFVASEFGFREARGVEFARELCEVARANAVRFKQKTRSLVEFTIVEEDAAKYPVRPDESVFLVCNPFDGMILEKVVDNIALSVRQHPRNILLIYHNPRWKHVIEERDDYRTVRELDFFGFKFSVYSNALAAQPCLRHQPAALRDGFETARPSKISQWIKPWAPRAKPR